MLLIIIHFKKQDTQTNMLLKQTMKTFIITHIFKHGF